MPWEELLALVVPPTCAACRAPGARAGDVLCAACRRALPWLPDACCERCAQPLPCRRCPAAGAAFAAAWSAVAYEGVARDAIRALKFERARVLADVMAAQIAARIPAALLRDTTLVAVPAHPIRLRVRGFDPAELLTRALARRTGLALQNPLARGVRSGKQLGASGEARRRPGHLTFAVRGRARVPATVVLIDDVHTTGATLDACATALRGAGAERVVAVSWARTIRR